MPTPTQQPPRRPQPDPSHPSALPAVGVAVMSIGWLTKTPAPVLLGGALFLPPFLCSVADGLSRGVA